MTMNTFGGGGGNPGDGPEIKAIERVTSPTLIVVCVGGAALLALCLVAVTCFCYRRRANRRHLLNGGKRVSTHGSDHQPLAFGQSQRRSTPAVKSPAGGGPPGGHHYYLKKSPSPTSGQARTPPGSGGTGISGHNTPSPTSASANCLPGALEAGVNANGHIHPYGGGNNHNATAAAKDVFTTETESPNKEDTEVNNEKNLQNVQNGPSNASSYLGQLVFKLRYKHDKNALIVSVVRCRDLPSPTNPPVGGAAGASSDPYVKLQLLPDKQHKVKTRVLRKTRNPVYDEDFTFYGIDYNQLKDITLHFVVLSFDRYSRDDIIGEVFCGLNTIDLSQAECQQMALCREIQPRSLKIKSQGRGELLVSLCWQPAANRLTVVVLKARNLPKMDVTGLADPYVKIYLLYNGQRIAKKKTHVKKRTLSPVYNESFVFDVPLANAINGNSGDGNGVLDQVSLEFLLLDWDRVTKNEVIGRLDLGGPKCAGSALHHWNEVCNSPRRQIADWHKLRE